jgi:hypothetical protein
MSVQNNVQQGDTAIALDGIATGMACTVCESDGYMIYTPTGERMFMWRVVFSRPVKWTYVVDPGNLNCGAYPDNWLRKIGGDTPESESTDEQLTKPVVPELVPA